MFHQPGPLFVLDFEHRGQDIAVEPGDDRGPDDFGELVGRYGFRLHGVAGETPAVGLLRRGCREVKLLDMVEGHG